MIDPLAPSPLVWAAAHAARHADARRLAELLRHCRARTLGLMDAWAHALPSLQVPQRAELNPPLWEWGHVAWFQAWWIERNRQRAAGIACDPGHPRARSRQVGADALYDSSHVAHAARWSLPLPDLEATRTELAKSLERTLELLAALPADADDHALYFWRLVLFHEDMHNEASVWMARALDIALPPALAARSASVAAPSREGRAEGVQIEVAAQDWQLGIAAAAGGFAFDNECGTQIQRLQAFRIDARPVHWALYLAFVEETGRNPPRHLRCEGGRWLQWLSGQWQALDMAEPAVHLSAIDAQAWCDWAGRRLPTEAEWECAAMTRGDFAWGRVWEWTASDFTPYAGFAPHPYRDYSAPWFGTHRVLRGACEATAPTMAHPKYRNFFLPQRRDVFAGFRSVAIS